MFEQLLSPIGVALDPVFHPLTIFPPYITVLIMAIILTVVITFVSRLFVNRKVMMQLKEKMEEIKEKLNQAQKSGNKEEQEKMLGELMKVNGDYMRSTMRIMAVSIVVVIIFFPWLTHQYSPFDSEGKPVAVKVVELPFEVPFVKWTSLEWFWWYVIAAFAAGTAMRKVMGSDI